jgi:ATP adenylyltransferase
VAGAGLPGHFHMHVVPRWAGDTNFMPVVGEAKVLPESLEETYRRIKSGFDNNYLVFRLFGFLSLGDASLA